MTGLVVVSHSDALARAAVVLARQMITGDGVAIGVAAGLDDGGLGTDAVAIAEAVAATDDGSGVVVLMDLGSAVLSAEMALELIDPDLAERVLLCPAPLVEGLVAAAVAAAGGASPVAVAQEATSALAAKQAQLAPAGPPGPAAPPDPAGASGPLSAGTEEPDVVGSFEVVNEHGIHARPAAEVVGLATGTDAQLQLRNRTTGSAWVSARSLSRVALLAARQGHVVEARATGPGARSAVDALVARAAEAFGEAVAPAPATVRTVRTAAAPAPPAVAPTSGPAGASPGFAVGRVVGSVTDRPAPATERPTGTPQEEAARLHRALEVTGAELRALEESVAADLGRDEAAIFAAQSSMLRDEDLVGAALERIAGGGSAEAAWAEQTERVAAEFDALTDEHLRARGADVLAIRAATLRALDADAEGSGPPEQDPSPTGSAGAAAGAAADGVARDVVVAHDLSPADVARLDLDRVVGVVLAAGSPTGHSAIIARSREVPVVVGAGPAVLDLAPGTPLALDGTTGRLWVDPTGPELAEIVAHRERAEQRAARDLSRAAGPAATVDGTTVLVGANVAGVADARVAAERGADLAGLVRTEFLFLGRDDAPDVDEQVATYLGIADALGGRRITLRTLDVGGDKPLPYARQPREDNPFLGVRGLRLALAEERLLRDQLRAVVEVAHRTPVSLMFPMVSTLAELLAARRHLDEAVAGHGRGRPAGLEVGIMVEVPAAALKAATFSPVVDFLSIGTNDLTQYTLAAERGNPALTALSDPLDPGVLMLVDAVCSAAGPDTLVAVCGELAADLLAVPLLTAMGVRELSVAAPSVPGVKEAVRRSTSQDRGLVERCLAASDAAEVRRFLAEAGPEPGPPAG